MKLSQRQNVLRHLLGGPLCGTTRDPELGQRIAARINELRKVGFVIDNERCGNDAHQHRTKQIEYVCSLDMWQPGGVSPNDWCAYCGKAGTLRLGDSSIAYGGRYWLVYKCDRCGRKDLR